MMLTEPATYACFPDISRHQMYFNELQKKSFNNASLALHMISIKSRVQARVTSFVLLLMLEEKYFVG